MKKNNFLLRHLREEANEKYSEHFLFAFKNAIILIIIGLALLIHSIMPWFFTTVASRNVRKLNQIFQDRATRFKNNQSK